MICSGVNNVPRGVTDHLAHLYEETVHAGRIVPWSTKAEITKLYWVLIQRLMFNRIWWDDNLSSLKRELETFSSSSEPFFLQKLWTPHPIAVSTSKDMNPATGNGKVRISYPPPMLCHHLEHIEIEIIGLLVSPSPLLLILCSTHKISRRNLFGKIT